MAVISFPDFSVASFRWRKAVQAVTHKGPFGGTQSIESAFPLWEVEMTGVTETRADARQIDTWLESFNGFANQVELWNLEHPAPSGTMRGSMTLNADVAQGATSLEVTSGAGQAGKTLLKGDFLGFGSGVTQHVIKAAADATANSSGVIVITTTSPVRSAFAAGTPIVWDRPKALFRQKTLNEGIEYTPDGGQPWSLSLIEDWKS